MSNKILLSIFILLTGYLYLTPVSNAQVVTKRASAGIPQDKSGLSTGNQGSPTLVLPAVAVDQLIAEDELSTKMGVPFRFGTNQDVDVNIVNEGQVSETNGYRVYQYQVYAQSAYSLNLIFNRFRLIEGARLYISDPNRTMVIGPITSQQNPTTNEYWTDIIAGDQLIIELQEPISTTEHSDIHLSSVIHGYKNLFQNKSQDKVFGSSASCQLNITCYPNLQNEADGVVMILLDQATRLCTGSMVNNTRQNFRSFLLTAFHCVDIGTYVNGVRTSYNDGVLNSAEIAQAQNWLIRFNYQSPTCSPSQEDNEVVTINGSVLRSAYNQSDFALLEIYQQIPTDVNTTYLGWSQANANTSNAFSIHHPQGDVKKISFTNADTQISGYGNSTGSNHLTVSWGNLGVTEGGSSGSPLFDANKRIVGQLHGGPSYCGAPSSLLADYYGRLYTSWTGGGSVESRMSDWLDPLGTNSQTTNSVKPTINGPGSITTAGTFSLNVLDGSILSWVVTGASGVVSPMSGTGTNANLTVLGVGTSLTITYTINAGQPYPIKFTKVFDATLPAPAAPAGGISDQTTTVGFAFTKTIPAFTDARALTYTLSGLPVGLSFNASTRTISGSPLQTGVSAITVTATNTANLSTTLFFQITVVPQGPLVLLDPTYNCVTRQLVFQYSGGSNEPIQFMSIGITNWTTSTSFIVDAGLASDPNTGPLLIYARQGSVLLSKTFNIRTYCIDKIPNSGPVAPTLSNQSGTVGQFFTYIFPAFTDPQPLTYQALGLPAGLSFSPSVQLISGTPFTTGISTVTIVATDTDGLSARATFAITVYAANTTPAALSLTAPTYNCQTGAITFATSGGDGTTIEYMAVGITPWTTNPNQIVEAGLRNDQNAGSLVLRARQSSVITTREFNIRQYCLGAGQNYAPIAPTIPSQTALVGQPYSYTIPAFSDNQTLTYLVSGIPYGLSFNFQKLTISGTPSFAANYNVTITAFDPSGLSASASFVISVVTTAPSAFALLAPAYNCSTRQLTFQTTGGNGTTVQYMAVGVTGWTTNPFQIIEAAVVADPNNSFITLNAQQNGVIVSRNFNFRQACGSAREASTESATNPMITVLGNPTFSSEVEAELSGMGGQEVTVQILDLQGKIHSEQLIKQAAPTHPIRMRLGKAAGVYLLHVYCQGKAQTVRVIKGQ